METETRSRWQDWLNLGLGLWLFVTPFFGFGMTGGVAAFNGCFFGLIIIALSALALTRPKMWEEWVNLFIGLWLVIAPFALFGYVLGGMLMWNSVIVGLLVGGDAIWAMASRRMGATPRMPHHA